MCFLFVCWLVLTFIYNLIPCPSAELYVGPCRISVSAPAIEQLLLYFITAGAQK